MVIDGNTGQVLHAQAADETRYPASLTKMMTLYIAFELMEQGRMVPATRIKVSDEAAGTSPSKLGLPAGSDIALADALRAIVTKSANDMAVALAEHIAGSERKFAILMTRKARELGMTATTFKNAHGLPDGEQVTTARDMLTLALRLNDDFPKQYALFGLRAFSYNGKTHRNHNTMLGVYPGMDGLKTGYTTASGFNLVASVRRNGKYVVAAVFGGSTASARNAHMRTILDRALAKASTEQTRTQVAAARGERRARAGRKAVAEAAAGQAGNAPALVEPVRPAERPRAAATPPPMPQRVAEALRRTETRDTRDAAAIPSAAERAGAVAEARDTPAGASAAQETTARPLPSATPIEVYKVRPVMVAPRARPSPPVADVASREVAPVEREPRGPNSRDAAAFDPPPEQAPGPGTQRPRLPSFVPANLQQARPQMPVERAATPSMSAPAPVAIPAASVAAPVAVRPPTRIRRAAAPTEIAPPSSATSLAAPAPVEITTPGRGRAPSSLQAQAERLRRGAELSGGVPEPARPFATANAGAASGPSTAYRLNGPAPSGAAPPAAAEGIAIQVGAYATPAEAQRQLEAVRARSGAILGHAQPSTQAVQTGGRQLYRARFVGLDQATATTACTELRRRQIDCHVSR